MNLLTLNVDSVPFLEYAQRMSSSKGGDILFIDWIPTTGPITENTKKQIEIVEAAPQGVRIIVFDRFCSMRDTEIKYFNDREAILMEPQLMTRPGFMFMPYFIDRLDLPLSTWDRERPYHIGVKGKVLSTESEACLLKSIQSIPDVKIGVDVETELHPDRFNTLSEVMDIGEIGWMNFNTTIVTGTANECWRGVLPDISNHLKAGVIPLVHHKHRWFHSIFKHFIMFDQNDVSWYKTMYGSCNYGFMDQLYKNIDTYMPQMITENFVQMLIELAK